MNVQMNSLAPLALSSTNLGCQSTGYLAGIAACNEQPIAGIQALRRLGASLLADDLPFAVLDLEDGNKPCVRSPLGRRRYRQ